MVGCRVAVAVINEKCVVVDAVEEIDHFVHSQRAAAIVIEKGVEGLELDVARTPHKSHSATWQALGWDCCSAHLLEVQLLKMADCGPAQALRGGATVWDRTGGRTEHGQRCRHKGGACHPAR